VRAIGINAEAWRMIKQGEEALQRILHSDGDGVFGNMQRDGYRRVVMPPSVGFGAAEPLL
jgi:hypothetical protein